MFKTTPPPNKKTKKTIHVLLLTYIHAYIHINIYIYIYIYIYVCAYTCIKVEITIWILSRHLAARPHVLSGDCLCGYSPSGAAASIPRPSRPQTDRQASRQTDPLKGPYNIFKETMQEITIFCYICSRFNFC